MYEEEFQTVTGRAPKKEGSKAKVILKVSRKLFLSS